MSAYRQGTGWYVMLQNTGENGFRRSCPCSLASDGGRSTENKSMSRKPRYFPHEI